MKEKIKVKISGIPFSKKLLKSLNPKDITDSIGFFKVKVNGIMKEEKIKKILKIIEEKNENKT